MNLTPNQLKSLLEIYNKDGHAAAKNYLQSTLGFSDSEAEECISEHTINTENTSQADAQLKERVMKSMKSGKSTGKWIGAIFTIVGIGLMLGAGYMYNERDTFISKAITVSGKVVDFDSYESDDDDGGTTTMYTTIFEYTYQDNTYRHYSDVSSSSPDYDLGEEVELFINPESPQQALANTFFERWFTILILGGLGVMFTGAGFGALKMG